MHVVFCCTFQTDKFLIKMTIWLPKMFCK